MVGKTIFAKFVEPPNEAESTKFGENKLDGIKLKLFKIQLNIWVRFCEGGFAKT